MSWMAYCIFASRGPLPELPGGVDGHPVFPVEANGLGLAVSKAADARVDAQRVLAYEAVVEAVHADRAVLPLRYGCLLEGTAEAADMLKRHGQAYRAALEKLEGYLEMGVRILAEETNGQPAGAAPTPPAAAPSGKAYLLARRAHWAEPDPALAEEVEETCRRAFEGLFVSCKAEGRGKTNPVFQGLLRSLYFLIAREHVDAFREAYRRLSRKTRAKLLLSGPWPPYNFVPAEPFEHSENSAAS